MSANKETAALENQITAILSRNTVTDIAGSVSDAPDKVSYWDVISVTPNRSNPSKNFLLSGNPAMLAPLTSLILVLDKLLGSAGESVNLDEWIVRFENCFPAGKFKPVDYGVTTPWGLDKSNLPKIVKVEEVGNLITLGFFPDRSVESEFYLFTGTPSTLIAQIHNFFACYQAGLGGTFLGYPTEEYLRPPARSGITLKIVLLPTPQPTKKAGYGQKQVSASGRKVSVYPVQVTVPQPRRSEISFQRLKEVCGGESGLSWGNWKARAYLADQPTKSLKGLRQLVASGASKGQAESNLDRFLSLTDCYVAARTCTEMDLNVGVKGEDPLSSVTKSYQVYPGWVFIGNPMLVQVNNPKYSGKVTLIGRQTGKQAKLWLWPKSEPAGWASVVSDLMKPVEGAES